MTLPAFSTAHRTHSTPDTSHA